MQDGWKTRRSDRSLPKVLKFESSVEKAREIMRVSTWTEAFDLIRNELEMVLERDVLPATLPDFTTVRQMTLGLNNPILVPCSHKNGIPCSLGTPNLPSLTGVRSSYTFGRTRLRKRGGQ